MRDEDEYPDDDLYDDFEQPEGDDEYFGSDDWAHDKEREARLLGGEE